MLDLSFNLVGFSTVKEGFEHDLIGEPFNLFLPLFLKSLHSLLPLFVVHLFRLPDHLGVAAFKVLKVF